MMNWKKLRLPDLRHASGYRFPHLFRQYAREFDQNRLADTARQGLARLLRHCRTAVPYYAQFWKDTTESQWTISTRWRASKPFDSDKGHSACGVRQASIGRFEQANLEL